MFNYINFILKRGLLVSFLLFVATNGYAQYTVNVSPNSLQEGGMTNISFTASPPGVTPFLLSIHEGAPLMIENLTAMNPPYYPVIGLLSGVAPFTALPESGGHQRAIYLDLANLGAGPLAGAPFVIQYPDENSTNGYKLRGPRHLFGGLFYISHNIGSAGNVGLLDFIVMFGEGSGNHIGAVALIPPIINQVFAMSGISIFTASPFSGNFRSRYARVIFINPYLKFVVKGQSNLMTVHAPTAFSVSSPLQIGQGADVPITWTGPATGGSGGTWIGIYRLGDDDTAFTSWQYTGAGTSGSLSLPTGAGHTPGHYEERLYISGYNPGAVQQFIITVPTGTVTVSPSPAVLGSPITANWVLTSGAAIPSYTWLGIFPAGATSTGANLLTWSYVTSTSGTTSGGLSFNISPSLFGIGNSYDARLFGNNGFDTVISSTSFGVVAPTYTLSAPNALQGESIAITWSTTGVIQANTQWIGIHEAGTGTQPLVAWSYLPAGASTGTLMLTVPLTTSLTPSYEITLYATNTFANPAITLPITISQANVTLTANPNPVTAGSPIAVNWNGGVSSLVGGTGNSWIGVYAPGNTPGPGVPIVVWSYVPTSGITGSLNLTIPANATPGNYTVHVFATGTGPLTSVSLGSTILQVQ